MEDSIAEAKRLHAEGVVTPCINREFHTILALARENMIILVVAKTIGMAYNGCLRAREGMAHPRRPSKPMRGLYAQSDGTNRQGPAI